MRAIRVWLLVSLLCAGGELGAQSRIDSIRFFTDTSVLDVTLVANQAKIVNNKMKAEIIDGRIEFNDGIQPTYNEPIRLSSRGEYRKENCFIPSLKLYFKGEIVGRLSPLHSLKMVCTCKPAEYYDQLLLKEFLVYKIYNVLTDKSFRVRLMHVHLVDSLKKKKTIEQFAFLIEDADAMAKRNKCRELKDDQRFKTESTDRHQITLVSIFQYMIGNTDWSVPYNHNIRLIKLKKDTVTRPFPVPYDFDYAGLVNALYAVPAPELGMESVLERNYRGFPRNMAELEMVLQPFRDKKEKIYAIINECEPLSKQNKAEMIKYLEEFYTIINNPSEVKNVFIDHARLE